MKHAFAIGSVYNMQNLLAKTHRRLTVNKHDTQMFKKPCLGRRCGLRWQRCHTYASKISLHHVGGPGPPRAVLRRKIYLDSREEDPQVYMGEFEK